MPEPVNLAVIASNLLAGAGLAALLGVAAWVSWGVVRSRATTQHHLLRSARQRLVPASWAALAVFAVTCGYGEVRSASLGLPHAWEVGDPGGNRAYALLALGAYLFVLNLILGLAALSSTGPGALARAGGGRGRDGGSDLAAALLSTLLLAAALVAVVAMAAVGYLQILASTLH